MNAVCVIDSSLPPYAAPLAHECVAMVLVPQESPIVAGLTGGAVVAVALLVVLMVSKALAWLARAFWA